MMTEMRAVVVKTAKEVKTAGDPKLTDALSEGVYAAEVARLTKENQILKEELKRAQERIELFEWGRSREADRRLAELREKATKQPSIWVRLLLGIRLATGIFINTGRYTA